MSVHFSSFAMNYLQSAALVLLLCASATNAHAQLRVGFHAGATVNPNALTLGVHATYPVGQSGVYLVPSVTYGFGSERNTAGQRFDFRSYSGTVRAVYPIRLSRGNDFVFSPQAGPIVYHHVRRDCSGDCSYTGYGVNIGAGMRFAAFSVSAMAGIGPNLPDATIGIGLAF